MEFRSNLLKNITGNEVSFKASLNKKVDLALSVLTVDPSTSSNLEDLRYYKDHVECSLNGIIDHRLALKELTDQNTADRDFLYFSDRCRFLIPKLRFKCTEVDRRIDELKLELTGKHRNESFWEADSFSSEKTLSSGSCNISRRSILDFILEKDPEQFKTRLQRASNRLLRICSKGLLNDASLVVVNHAHYRISTIKLIILAYQNCLDTTENVSLPEQEFNELSDRIEEVLYTVHRKEEEIANRLRAR